VIVVGVTPRGCGSDAPVSSIAITRTRAPDGLDVTSMFPNSAFAGAATGDGWVVDGAEFWFAAGPFDWHPVIAPKASTAIAIARTVGLFTDSTTFLVRTFVP